MELQSKVWGRDGFVAGHLEISIELLPHDNFSVLLLELEPKSVIDASHNLVLHLNQPGSGGNQIGFSLDVLQGFLVCINISEGHLSPASKERLFIHSRTRS
jgi:hypothetical protein